MDVVDVVGCMSFISYDLSYVSAGYESWQVALYICN